jgi:hypothetical protein
MNLQKLLAIRASELEPVFAHRIFVSYTEPDGLALTCWVCLVADKSNGFVRLHEYNKFGNTTGNCAARH